MVEGTADIEPAERVRKVEALNAALGRLARVTPELCVDYHKALVIDQERWQRHIQVIRQQPRLRRELALDSLARTGARPLTWYTRNSTSLGRRRTAPAMRPVQARELQSRIPCAAARPGTSRGHRCQAGMAIAHASRSRCLTCGACAGSDGCRSGLRGGPSRG